MKDWMEKLRNQRAYSRHLVPLAPGEAQPTYALEPPPTPGYRWETDKEFSERIMEELAKKASAL